MNALVGPWKLGWDHAYLVVFAAAIILMPLSNPLRSDYPLSSMWRFALECTVAFMVVAGLNLVFFDEHRWSIRGTAALRELLMPLPGDSTVITCVTMRASC